MRSQHGLIVLNLLLASCTKSVKTTADIPLAEASVAGEEMSASPAGGPPVTAGMIPNSMNSAPAGEMTTPRDRLDYLSFPQLANYISKEANDKDIAALARRDFWFDISNNHQAFADEYAAMQEAIAARIPDEWERPVFDVKFRFGGERKDVRDDHTVGILGGTGPLSDAHIIREVVKKLDPKNLPKGTMIHLYSLPPPRNGQEALAGGITYAGRMATFMRRGYKEYFLASNTAHLAFSSLSVISGSKQLNHLPQMIADRIALENRKDKIIILGTKTAWKGHLYDKIFDAISVPNVLLSETDADLVQAWIDRIKEGRFAEADRLELKAFLAKLATQYQAKGLLLSCTELPLGLGAMMEELKTDGFTVYDTEKMIAEIMVAKTEGLAH